MFICNVCVAHTENVSFCPKQLSSGGRCRNSCVEEFVKQYGASAMPTHCTCQDLPVPGSMHLCTCCVVCGVVEDKTHTVLPEVQINYDTLTYQCNNV